MSNTSVQPNSPRASLYARAVRGGAWTVLAYGADTATRIVSSLIMTRLLFPEAFGLIAAATSILVGLTLVSDVGIRTVILRSPHGDTPNFLRFAWSLQVCRGTALWLMLLLVCALLSTEIVRSSLPIRSVFVDHQFPAITAVLGLSLLLSGLESTSVHLSVRRLDLRPVIFIDVIARLAALPFMLLLTWLTMSVWAIVTGSLLASAIRLIVTHCAIPGPRMKWRWDRQHITEFAHFGKWISISSSATFVASQGDRIFIGLFLSSSLLGLYSIAKIPMEALSGLFEKLNSSLTVPVLGEVIRNEQSNLKNKYYRFRLPFDLVAPLLGGIVYSAGGLLVQLLYDVRYADAGHMLQLLAISLVMYPSSLISSAFPLTGSPQTSAVVSAVQAISLFVFMLGGFAVNGATGIVLGIAVHRFVPSLLILWLSYQKGWIDIVKELRVVPAFGMGVLIGKCMVESTKSLGLQ